MATELEFENYLSSFEDKFHQPGPTIRGAIISGIASLTYLNSEEFEQFLLFYIYTLNK